MYFSYLYRISIFDFVVDDTQEEPIVKFVGENPVLQYVSDQKSLKVLYMSQYVIAMSSNAPQHLCI